MISITSKKILPVAALLLIPIFSSFSRAEGLRSIRKQYNSKLYDQASRALRNELPSLRGRSLAQGRLLMANLETNVYDASNLYRKVINDQSEKEALEARVELAKIYYSTEDYDGVLKILAGVQPADRSADSYEAVYFRGLALKELGEADRARSEFVRIDRGKYLYWSYIAQAELDMQSGRIGDAIKRYEMIAGDHSNPVAGFRLGECYEIMGETEKALDVYRNLVRLFPESLETPKAREKIQMINRSRNLQQSERAIKREGGVEREKTENVTGPASAETIRYTLQFGSFSEEENARAFAEELGSSIGDLRIETFESKGRVWHRVRAGIYSSREQAEADALRFMEISGYSSKVLLLE